MKVVIHQPEYLPWLGFFDKLDKCDLFVFLDHVQYQKGFINRNKIKTDRGWQWLTVPIIHKYHRQPINKVKIDNQTNWRKNHWKTMIYYYNQTPYFKKYAQFFKDVFKQNWVKLVDLDIYLIKNLMKMLGIKTPLKKSSLLKVKGKKTELLINICKVVEANTYLSGEGGRQYMDLKMFEKKGIKVLFQDFRHAVYPQQFDKKSFLPKMSAIDLLFNCGEESFNIIKG